METTHASADVRLDYPRLGAFPVVVLDTEDILSLGTWLSAAAGGHAT